MLQGKEDQQRIRLTWPLKRGGFPDEQPSMASSSVMVLSGERKAERSHEPDANFGP